jgi:hypothetical protein
LEAGHHANSTSHQFVSRRNDRLAAAMQESCAHIAELARPAGMEVVGSPYSYNRGYMNAVENIVAAIRALPLTGETK